MQGFHLSAIDYITKPFRVEEVLARIEKHLSIQRLQNALKEKNAQLNREIAERKRIEAELRRSQRDLARAKTTFLANMSHELRTPLNGVLGYAQLLLDYTMLTPEPRNYVQTVARSGQHLLMLIDDVLDIAKIEAGRVTLLPKDVHLNTFLTSIADIIRIWAVQKKIGFETQFLPNLPAIIHADEKRLRQILINLLGNAVKFTVAGKITLRVEPTAARENYAGNSQTTIRFAISDTGPGIPLKEQEEIFQPFYQGPEQCGALACTWA